MSLIIPNASESGTGRDDWVVSRRNVSLSDKPISDAY